MSPPITTIEISFYTDPLCCWSWVMQPQWKKLLDEFGDSLHVTYKMVGLLPSWNNFSDSTNSIRKPIQMGPEWMHARETSGVYIDDSIWVTDPPASSFPACIAVKSVELQSHKMAAVYLSMVQEAVMTKRMNIALTAVLLELANDLGKSAPDFNLFKFREDLFGEAGKEAFRKDWQEARYRGITRFPTLVFRASGHNPVLVNGLQFYDAMKDIVLKLTSGGSGQP
ncbi:MAG TPA: DsbA family protein [Puia sp.]|jgi:predicted DsbA family dithiol-disulfide isomerase|nr:DsbA family protein [Puia sp.]